MVVGTFSVVLLPTAEALSPVTSSLTQFGAEEGGVSCSPGRSSKGS